MALHLLTSHSLAGDDIARQICNAIDGKPYLHLCANQSVKNERINTVLQETSVPYEHGKEKFNFATSAEFDRFLRQKALQKKGTIRVSDERIVLQKAIRHLFKDKPTRQKLFMNLRFQLYELYTFLQFHNVRLTETSIEQIGIFYSDFEREVFLLYNLFSSLMQSLTSNSPNKDILGDAIVSKVKSLGTIYERTKKVMCNVIETIDILVLDGLLFLDDFQSCLIEETIKRGKQVYLTVQNSDPNSFPLESGFPALFARLNHPYVQPIPPAKSSHFQTALSCVKNNLHTFPSVENVPLLEDETIQFIRPFSNRNHENLFIAHEISNLLRRDCGTDIAKLRAMLESDIAVVDPYTAYGGSLERIFKDVGVFLYKEDTCLDLSELSKGQVSENFDNVYFSRADFLNEEITFESGDLLTHLEKNKLFDMAFEGITTQKRYQSIMAYPIGQYVFKIYDILLNGMSVSKFKEILFSNWQYTIHGGVKWDCHLGALKSLEIFYDKKTTLEDWVFTTMVLLSRKAQVDRDKSLRYHPLACVPLESLQFFRDFLIFLQEVIVKIGAVTGGIQEHVAFLKETVIGTLPQWEDPTFEQKIITDLIVAVSNISESPIVQEVTALDFAESLQVMFREYERELEEQSNESSLYFNTISLTNTAPYKYVFLPAFESQNYPRPYRESFPFSPQILEILSSPQYGIERVPHHKQGINHHIQLEDYLFKNVLDFTTEQLIITMTESEGESRNSISHYAHDITSMFDSEIPWETPQITQQEIPVDDVVKEKIPPLYLPMNGQYTLAELMMFKLCPRRFLHQQMGSPAYTSKFQLQFYFMAVLFSATQKDFCRINRENKMVYSTETTEAQEKICEIFEEIYQWYLPLFPIFNPYELSDIRRTVTQRLIGTVSDMERKKILGKRFTVVDVSETPQFSLNGFDLVLEYDTIIHDLDNKGTTRSSQSSIFLDFLATKTEDPKGQKEQTEDRVKYRMLKAELEKDLPENDRVNLMYTMLNRINIQFESGSQRFMFGDDSGAERVNAIVEEIRKHNFAYAIPKPSKYCVYCPVQDVCKAKGVAQ